MDEREFRLLADKLRRNEIKIDDFIRSLKGLPFKDLGEVKLDTHRSLRNGFAEIIFCPGKTREQLEGVAGALAECPGKALFSRMTPEQYQWVLGTLPGLEYLPKARMGRLWPEREAPSRGMVLIVTGGSGDVPVAEEAAVTAETMGCEVRRLYDVGVAGLHRLLAHLDVLFDADVIVAVAGMDGALPGVVAGIVGCPVVAVPTSVGYGVALGGIGPLVTMLNSCALGVSVVNIDNGVGAGFTAALIAGGKKEKNREGDRQE
ncbi:MAG TPA: nickel pincer cofactor biosynthesis protein LarB [Synergistales bacterium]|nr:nickel pincer cofactor biosynthesis protein LarB [Synergistales bacterium]